MGKWHSKRALVSQFVYEKIVVIDKEKARHEGSQQIPGYVISEAPHDSILWQNTYIASEQLNTSPK